MLMNWENYNKNLYNDTVDILRQWEGYNPYDIWVDDGAYSRTETYECVDIDLVRALVTIIHEKDEQIKNQKSLNKNLKRICKERANQDRQINKKSSGYVMLSERSRKLKNIKDSKGNCRTFYLMSMQTPYNLEFRESDVILQFRERFVHAFIFSEKSSFEIKESDINDNSYKYFTFNYEFNLNYNTGYWEVTFLCNRRFNLNKRYI